MNAVYGPKDRAHLNVLADTLAATGPGGAALGRRIADILRSELPDVDDLTIGRVLVALGTGRLATLFVGPATLDLTWQGLTAAGLAMTEPEWKEGAR